MYFFSSSAYLLSMDAEELIDFMNEKESELQSWFMRYFKKYSDRWDGLMQETRLRMLEKLSEGKLELDNLTRLKGYFFIAFRNQVYKIAREYERVEYEDNYPVEESDLEEVANDSRNYILQFITEDELEFMLKYESTKNMRGRRWTQFERNTAKRLRTRIQDRNLIYKWVLVRDNKAIKFKSKSDAFKHLGINNRSHVYTQTAGRDDFSFFYDDRRYRIIRLEVMEYGEIDA